MHISPTDEELMIRVKETNDRNSFGLLMKRHWSKTKSLAAFFLRESNTAEDAAQESFLRVLQYRASYKSDMAFSPWLSSVVRRVCLDHITKRKKQDSKLKQLEFEKSLYSPTKEDLSTSKKFELELLKSLSSKEEKILRLRIIHEMSFGEIAKIMQCSEEAAKKKAQRALQKLRKKILIFQKIKFFFFK